MAVPAHEEAVAVKRMLDDPTEFGHWNGGKVVEVQTAEGTGWYYPGEKGEWEKIYESGFDYEAIHQAAVRFLEATDKIKAGETIAPEQIRALLREVGKQYLDNVRYFTMKGRWSAGAYVDESAPWWPSKLFGVNMGPMWMRVKTDNGAYVNALVSYLGEPYDKEGDLAMVPIAWGYEYNGQWQNLLGYGYGSPYIQTDEEIDDYFEEMSQVESNLANNLERKMHVAEMVWVSARGMQGEGLSKGTWQIGEGQKWWYKHVGGPARWWSQLSATERENIKDRLHRKNCTLAGEKDKPRARL